MVEDKTMVVDRGNDEGIIKDKIRHDLNSLTTFEESKIPEEESSNAKILEILLDNKNINLKTEVSDGEILELAKLETVANKLNNNILAQFLTTFKELRVSKNRQGRKEIVGNIREEEEKSRNFIDQFVGDLAGKNRSQ